MELFDEKLEQAILSKEYFELSPEEKDGIKDFITNEEEYMQFRGTLLMSADIQTENIKPTADTKASLMSMMESSRPERKIWYNSIGLFLFPEDKPLFAKPGIYASLAAILLLAFFFVPMDFSTQGGSGNMAENEQMSNDDAKDRAPAEEDMVAAEQEPSAKTLNKESIIMEDEELKTELLEDNKMIVLEENMDELDDNLALEGNGYGNGNGGGAFKKKEEDLGNNSFTIDYSANVYPNADNNKTFGTASDSLNVNALGVAMRTNNKNAAHKNNQKDFISGDLKKDGFSYEILNDNALNQTDDLIDLLYTAD